MKSCLLPGDLSLISDPCLVIQIVRDRWCVNMNVAMRNVNKKSVGFRFAFNEGNDVHRVCGACDSTTKIGHS
jgi:hypothetical protein